MFAFFVFAGNLGATVGPSMVGRFSGMAGGNLKIGLLFAVIFHVALICFLLTWRSYDRLRHMA